jgi:hypothetical protein
LGIEALTHDDAGNLHVPETAAAWRDWISATGTRAYSIGDPVIDWLSAYGAKRGYPRDTEAPGYDQRTDFTDFIFRQGHAFEAAVIAHIRTLSPVLDVGGDRRDARDDAHDLSKAEQTFEAMAGSAPIIYQGVLRDAERRTYGMPDLLVRSDVLHDLFPSTISAGEAGLDAPGLGLTGRHYLVVDAKFTTLHLRQDGHMLAGDSVKAYRVQLSVYNSALGRLQGFLPPVAYLLGRSWEWTRKRQKERGTGCMERLGKIAPDEVPRGGKSPYETAAAAVAWQRRVRTEGADWVASPTPSVPELQPNPRNSRDSPWHSAKLQIAQEVRDAQWPTGSIAQGNGLRQPPLVATSQGNAITPDRLGGGDEPWRATGLAFYVDFETVNDLNDDFSRIPSKGGQNLIFTIGCGHVDEGSWVFESFTVAEFTEDAEATVIDAWLAHMEGVRGRLAPEMAKPMVFHWSPAETSVLEKSYNSAVVRHPERQWPEVGWFDFLNRVMRAEGVQIAEASGLGLKTVAQAMHAKDLIETVWEEGSMGGQGAMIGGMWCDEESRKTGVPADEIALMQEIVSYNEIDCKTMMEIIRYMREHH